MKRSLLVEADGGPLGVAVAGANVPDARLLAATIEAIVAERPKLDRPRHLCLDKGYDNETGWGVIVEYDYEPHIQMIRDLRLSRKKRHKPRRWVVERTLAWLAKCRAPDPLGQEGLQLPRTPQARLHANLVPPLLSPGTVVGPPVI